MENHIAASSKKPIVSLVCGIVAVFFPLLWIVSERLMTYSLLYKIEYFLYIKSISIYKIFSNSLFVFIYIVPVVLAIIGLIFGILGLKSSRKKMAIWGIVLSVIALLFWIYVCLMLYALWSYYNQ